MSASKVARRYARALIELCDEQKNHAVIAKQLESFASLYKESEPLQNVIKSPVVDLEEKKAILGKLFAKALYAPMTKNFLLVLLDHGRMTQIEDVYADFAELIDQRSKRVRATVKSAVPLAKADLNRIQSALQRLTGSTVLLETEVDEDLIGGVVTQIGNLVLDGSVRTQLETIGERLLAR